MERLSRRIVALLLAVLLPAAGCTAGTGETGPAPAATSERGVVRMRVVQSQGLTLAFVPVTISGEGPFNFALDTGASASVVDADIAEQLGLESTGEQRAVTGIIGMDRVELVRVTDWSLGDVPLESVDIASVDLPDVPRGEGLQGLLGSDVLSGFGRVTIDYDRQRLELDAG